MLPINRRLPIGVEVLGGGTSFRVWAPSRTAVEVLINGETVQLTPEANGYHSAVVPTAKPEMLYRFRLDGDGPYPDPASRYQPEGPHGPSQIVDPNSFEWTDGGWGGIPLEGQVIYEMHVGTFTPEGTFIAARAQLAELARIGITVLEVMPVADFPGRFGWGYDGVNLFAPSRIYGSPDDFRSFINTAHGLGMAVILDVVYNHLGPDGNYLCEFSEDYVTKRHKTDWGDAINFDGPNSGPVREYYLANVRYWIEEFHLDGFRLDATQDMYDESERHILADIAKTVREAGAGRKTILIGENEPQNTRLLRSIPEGGYGLDGLWNDDLHHSAMVAMTGHNDAYYTDYGGTPQEFLSCMKYGYLYQGQWYKWQKKRRGTSTFGLPRSVFVNFIQNHDQIANSARGERVHSLTTPGLYKTLTALTLLGSGTPMLFQGQEFASSKPFLFFADHHPELAEKVYAGRREFLAQWRSLRLPAIQAAVLDPSDLQTYENCKLDFSERESNRHYYDLHADLIALRRNDPVLREVGTGAFDGAVLSAGAFVLRLFSSEHGDRLVIVNTGPDLHLDPAPEPLLGRPPGMAWQTLLSTEDPKYGGHGTPALDTDENWRIPGHAAVVLVPVEEGDDRDG